MDLPVTTAPQVPRWQRQLLPGDAMDTGDARRSLRDWAIDACVITFTLGVGSAALAELWTDAGPAVRFAHMALPLLGCLLLWWRRRAPVAVAVGVLTLSALSLGVAGAALVVVFNAAIRASIRALVVISTIATASIGLAPRFYRSDTLTDLGAALVVVLIFVGWGLFVRAQRGLVAALHLQAHQAEHERAAEAIHARDAERRRIAREMHDGLAHRISMVSLHAGALEHRGADAAAEEIADAAGTIRAAAVAAMDELRGVIGLLRDGDGGAALEPPLPTLASIADLIDEHRKAGLFVTAELHGIPDGGDAHRTVQLAGYRVVQEGLTNARRHATGAAVHVIVEVHDEQLVATVRSEPPVATVPPATTSGRRGLTGLAERVTLLDGSLEHGIDDDGCFELTAVIPWSTL